LGVFEEPPPRDAENPGDALDSLDFDSAKKSMSTRGVEGIAAGGSLVQPKENLKPPS
jgi:hypothetical protein